MEEEVNQLTKFGLILGATCLAATLVLAVTHEVTRPKIEAQLKAEEDNALRLILPAADSFSAKSVDGMTYFEAVKDGTVVGYCIRVTATGYNGYIRMIVGIDTAGIIKGIQILEQNETPGLGAQIAEVSPGEKESYFLKQFKGKQARSVELRKNIDAITGATISSAAVTNAVRKAADEFLTKIK